MRVDHAAVVAAALATGETPLPARVGQTFPDDAALARELAARSRDLAGAVARLRGKVEMTLVVQLPEASASARPAEAHREVATTGRAYLEQLRARYAGIESGKVAGERIREAARASLGDLVSEDAVVPVRGARRFIVAHLVERGMADEWRRRAQLLSIEGSTRTFVAGPLPPYSFASTGGPAISPADALEP